jgi:hypothetical protein
MLRLSHAAWLVAGFLLCEIISNAALCLGEDFRVDNAVYQGKEKTAVSASVTIFHKEIVYDCMPQETVVFNKTAGRFVLLNMKNHARTEIAADDLNAFIKQLQPRAAQTADPLVKFLADPKFQQQFNESTRELTFASPLLTYRLTLSPQTSAAAVEQYREFSDWSAKLNAMLVPGSRPPFARLLVNAAVAERKAIVSQVVLTFTSGKPTTTTTIRSTHRVIGVLTPADLDGLAKIGEALIGFKLVGFDEYRKGGEK